MRWSIEELGRGIELASNRGSRLSYRVLHSFSSAIRITKVIAKWVISGYCWSSIWNLDKYMEDLIIQRLKLFKKMKKSGYPYELNNEQEWYNVIDEMILLWERKKNEFFTSQINYGNTRKEENVDILELKANLTYVERSPEEQKEVDRLLEEQRLNDSKALEMFTRYFNDLWD